jgi:hypothetical protein
VSAPTFPAGRRWRKIRHDKIEVGLIVSVLGIDSRQTAIMHVLEVQIASDRSHVVVHGRQPWGGGWRNLTRVLHPESEGDLLVDENGDPA